MQIPFNKPHITGKEVHFIYDAVASGHISGNGKYTKMCQNYFEERWGFKKTLLTTSNSQNTQKMTDLKTLQSKMANFENRIGRVFIKKHLKYT